jgi:hypothetical protein
LGRFRPFHYCTNVDAKLAKLTPLPHKFAEQKLRQNFSQRTHLIHPIGPKTHVLGRFGSFYHCTNVDTKLVKLTPLLHKFGERSCVEIFRNERT